MHRAVVSVVVVAALMLLGFGGAQAFAGPPNPNATPPGWNSYLPGYAPGAQPDPAKVPSFTYDSPYRLLTLADHKPPDADDLPLLAELAQRKGLPPGTYLALLKKWYEDHVEPGGDQSAKAWRDFVWGYTMGVDVNNRGGPYEKLVIKEEGLDKTPGQWAFNRPPQNAVNGRRPDQVCLITAKQLCLEDKYSNKLTPHAREQAQEYAENVDALGLQTVYLFGLPPNQADLNWLKNLNDNTELNKKRAALGLKPLPALVARYYPAIAQQVAIPDPELDAVLGQLKLTPAAPTSTGHVAVPSAPASVAAGAPASASATATATGTAGGKGQAKRPGRQPKLPGGGTAMVADPGQYPVAGGLTDSIAASADTPQDATAQQAAAASVAKDLGNPDIVAELQPLGGVDFSTLELRYVSDTYQGGNGLQYAFSAQPGPVNAPSYGGQRAAAMASNAFFVWLELPPSDFTVNLNPDEPDRIIDAKFGATDAGRILLKADLQMKKTVAKLIHPDTPAGARFWASLTGESKCVSMRQWIVPAPATIRQDGDELFILDAPLEVKLETDYTKTKGAGGTVGCPGQSQAETQRNETVFRSTILPQVQKAVNTAPEYADLRRVYVSRIAAQWYRERSQTKHTAYSGLVDGNDVSNWPAIDPTTPQDVFNQYVQSYTKGEFNVTHQTRQGNTIMTNTYVFGGVDFSRIPRTLMSDGTFAQQQPGLPKTVGSALLSQAAQHSNTLWFGGESTPVPLADIKPLQSPTGSVAFWAVAAIPLLLWTAGGTWLVYRRRRNRTALPTAAATGA